jgi:hypothetical protein
VVEPKKDEKITFVDNVVQVDDWSSDMDLDSLWRKMAQGISIVTKEMLDESKERIPLNKDAS